MFYKAGRIQAIEIKKGGFGFIEFTHPDDAREAVSRYNGRSLDGKVLRVESSIGHTRTRPLSSSGFAFEVTGFNPHSGRELTWRHLKDWASKTVEVTYTKVLSSTVGYIEVATRRDLDAAIDKLDNTSFHGSTVHVKSVPCLFTPTIDPETRERIRDDGRGRDRRNGYGRDDRRGGRGNSPRRHDHRSRSPRRDTRDNRGDSRGNRSPVRDSSRDRSYRSDARPVSRSRSRSRSRSPASRGDNVSPVLSRRASEKEDYQVAAQDTPFGLASSTDTTVPVESTFAPVYDAEDTLRDSSADM